MRTRTSWRLAVLVLVGALGSALLGPTPVSASTTVPAAGTGPAGIIQVLDRDARIPGIAWQVDPGNRQVVVSYDDTVTGAKLVRLRSVTARFGDAVRTERLPGILSSLISGGNAIYNGGARCTLGFNVRNSVGTEYFITAGHCASVGSSWYDAGNVYLGYQTGSSFPTNDYGIARHYSRVSRPGDVDLYNGWHADIKSSGNAVYGQWVCHVGSTSGYHCGYITALNVTINLATGTVYGLYQSNICSEPGDSGGPLFAGTVALGIIVAGNGNCSSGGSTYYQPITEPLSAYGVSVY